MAAFNDSRDNWKVLEICTAISLSVTFLLVSVKFVDVMVSQSTWDLFRIIDALLMIMALVYIPSTWFIIRKAHRDLQQLLVKEYSARPGDVAVIEVSKIMARVLGISSFAIVIIVMSLFEYLKH